MNVTKRGRGVGGASRPISDVRCSPLSPSLCQDACVKASPVPPPSSSPKCTKWIIHGSLSLSNPCWAGQLFCSRSDFFGAGERNEGGRNKQKK